ncbi:MAG TPA: helix-turn-helix domain-containing protein [Acidimicrobiales bacterium]|nr:helix-turn-helix domain-containing protein [Acidimicrobiales bacterium]
MSSDASAGAPPARPPGPSRSTTRAWRHEQLLRAAGQVLVERGPAGFTMEALAARAGVSRALSYQHFANTDEVLAALHRHEVGTVLGRLVEAAAAGGGENDPDAALAAVVHEWFDALDEQPALLDVLEARSDARRPPAVVSDLLGRSYHLAADVATALAGLLVGVVVAAASGVRRGEVARGVAETVTRRAVLGAVHAVATPAGP